MVSINHWPVDGRVDEKSANSDKYRSNERLPCA